MVLTIKKLPIIAFREGKEVFVIYNAKNASNMPTTNCG